MNTIAAQAPVNTARDANALLEQLNYGWNLYAANQPIERCSNLQQRRGFASAQRGHEASIDAETAAYLNGSNA